MLANMKAGWEKALSEKVYSLNFFNNLIHVVAHRFIGCTMYYKRLTLWSHKLTWSFLQSVLVCCESYKLSSLMSRQDHPLST